MKKPCRSPYCECTKGKCTHPGFYDARHVKFKWKGNEMDSFDSRLRQILNMFGIDSDIGVPDYIIEKFICDIIDSLTEMYQECNEGQDLSNVESIAEDVLIEQFRTAFRDLKKELKMHKNTLSETNK